MTKDTNAKSALVEALCALVATDLETIDRRQADTAAGATHEENRAEHAKDTRATEDSYLARGLAERAAALRRNLEALRKAPLPSFGEDDPITVGALVTVETAIDDETPTEERWFVVPGAAGLQVERDGHPVLAVQPASPLGQALLGLEPGDEGHVRTPRGTRRFEVLSVE